MLLRLNLAELTSANGCDMKSLVALMCSLPLLGSAESAVRQLNVAVVQFESVDGDVAGNLKTAEHWLYQAVAAGAELIVFPEFMPTGYHLGNGFRFA